VQGMARRRRERLAMITASLRRPDAPRIRFAPPDGDRFQRVGESLAESALA